MNVPEEESALMHFNALCTKRKTKELDSLTLALKHEVARRTSFSPRLFVSFLNGSTF